MTEEIIMDFDSAGNPEISVKGMKGQKCKLLTADLERMLGHVTSTELTSEYQEREARVNNVATNRISNKR